MNRILFYLLSITFLTSAITFSQTGWTTQNSGTNYLMNSLYFFNTNTGFAAGGNPNGCIILKTTNGGANWVTNYQSNSNINLKAIKFINTNTGFATGGYYPTSVIMKTTNQGITWISQSNPTTGTIYSISFVNADTIFSAAGYGVILKTTNGGANWLPQQTSISDHFEYVQFLNSNTGYAVARGGQVLKTTNSGYNWFISYNCGTWLNSASFINTNTGYTVGQSGITLFTNNGGTNWISQSMGTNSILNEVAFINQSTGFILGASGLIFKTTNIGVNWTVQPSGTNNDLYSTYFANDNTGYVCGDYGTILKTVTGGNPAVVPTLVYPPNNATNIPLTPSLTWLSNPPALYYKVQVSRLSDFSTIVDSATLNGQQRTIPAGRLTTNTTYFWRVNATTANGTGPWSDVWNFGTVSTGINQISSEIPDKNYLYNNYPNPFNPSTNIKYQITKNGYVSLRVFDMLGRVVSVLVDGKQTVGTYLVRFENVSLPSGIYYYKLSTEEFSDVKKMLFVK